MITLLFSNGFWLSSMILEYVLLACLSLILSTTLLLCPFAKFEDCQSCRMCCTFSDTDKIDAPLFTEEIRQRILIEFVNENIEFESVRQLWRIKLKPIDDLNRWICPLYERETAKC